MYNSRSTYLSGTVIARGVFLRNSLNRSSNAWPIVVITSCASPPPHSSTKHARPNLASLAT